MAGMLRNWRGDAIKADYRALMERRMRTAAAMVEGRVKMKLSQQGRGRVYIRGAVRHQASLPGDPPAVDTGRLRSSITHRVEASGPSVIGLVGTNVEYASYLEFGTSRMEARPFLRSTVHELGVDIARILAGKRR